MSSFEQTASSANRLAVARADLQLDLRDFTPARVALDRTGDSITTRHALEFSLAHAQARDAVHSTLGVAALMAALRERELAAVSVRSAAATRAEYLRRPDRGRALNHASACLLAHPGNLRPASSEALLSVIFADGLSALATERHALPVLDALLQSLEDTWALAPIVVAEQARVALGDEIGLALHADVTVMLIGERPGLSAPDSLGAYITWSPRPGRTDAERNCVSNIRSEGLAYASAAARIAWYINEGRRLGLTGVALRASDPKAMAPP
jgi:ethanolamine ammonia-lyase small subunit